jgi:hypothetical protein
VTGLQLDRIYGDGCLCGLQAGSLLAVFVWEDFFEKFVFEAAETKNSTFFQNVKKKK